MKFPGTYAAYALIMSIFGQTIDAIHLGLLLVNATTIALIFLMGRRLMDSTAGVAAAASYAILSVSPSVLGLAAHATNFVIPPVLAGTLLLLRASRASSLEPIQLKQFVQLFCSGLLFGIGALMKQPALFFIPFGASYIAWNNLLLSIGALSGILFPAALFHPDPAGDFASRRGCNRQVIPTSRRSHARD